MGKISTVHIAEAQPLQPFCLLDDPLTMIEGITGPVTSDIATYLKHEIPQAGARYVRRHEQTAASLSLSEQRHALSQLSSSKPAVQKRGLKSLAAAPDAGFALWLAAKESLIDEDIFNIFTLQLDLLSLLARRALEILPQKRGPQPRTDLDILVQELVDLYEIVTRKPATHNPQQKAAIYTSNYGGLNSPADRFVAGCVAIIFSALRKNGSSMSNTLSPDLARRVMTAMEYAVRHRKKERPQTITDLLTGKSPKLSM